MNMVKEAKEYAQQLVQAGFTFDQFKASWPNLAGSEYGDTVKAEMAKLSK